MQRLAGKIAIVTGAARGLGAATALRLADEGASVVLADVLEEGYNVAAGLRDAGKRASFQTFDVTDESGWRTLFAQTEGEFGGVDILVNNAAISREGHIEAISVDTLREVLDVNLIGAFLGMKAALPAMRKRGGGSIINVASSITERGLPFACAYGASKAALTHLTKTTAIHAARDGIRVNSVHPGPHETPMLFDGMKVVGDDALVEKINASVPLHRLGRPRDVAATVAFLASDDASYITAAELFVDGGLTAV